MPLDIVSRGLAARSLQKQPNSLEDYGGINNGTADQNRAAFRESFKTASAKISLAGDTYQLSAIPATDAVKLHRSGQQPAILIPKHLKRLDGRKAALKLPSCRGIFAVPFDSYDWPDQLSYLAADVAAGATTLTLEPGGGAMWSAGDEFLYRFGSLPYDIPEPIAWGFGQVKSVSGDVVTLVSPIPDAFAIASVAAQGFPANDGSMRYNKAIYKWPIFKDFEATDLQIAGVPAPGATEIAFQMTCAKRVALRNLAATNVGSGFALQYVDGGLIDNCSMVNTTTNQPSLRKAVGLGSVRGVVIRNLYVEGTSCGISVEANGEAVAEGVRFHNSGSPLTGASYGAACTPFNVQGRSTLVVRDAVLTGFGGYLLAVVGNGDPSWNGRVIFEGKLRLDHDTMPASLGPLEDMSARLDLRIGSSRELWDFRQARWFTRRFHLKNGMSVNRRFPPGIIKAAKVFVSSGTVPGTDLTQVYIGRHSDNGTNYVYSLVAGQTVNIAMPSDGSAIFGKRSEQAKVLVGTATGTNLDAASQFVDVDLLIVPDLLVSAFGWSDSEDARLLGQGSGLRSAQIVGYELASITANGSLTVDFTIPGMVPGDLIESVGLSLNRAGVTIADTQALTGSCRVVFSNPTASAVDLAAATVRVLWRKPVQDN